MAVVFQTKNDGDIVVNNKCPICCRFIKNATIKAFFHSEGFRWQMDAAVKITGVCKKHGKQDLKDYYFD